MPEIRLAKARATLPKGYQFGDAKPRYVLAPHTVMVKGERCSVQLPVMALPAWRHPSENAAERLAQRAHTQSVDDID